MGSIKITEGALRKIIREEVDLQRAEALSDELRETIVYWVRGSERPDDWEMWISEEVFNWYKDNKNPDRELPDYVYRSVWKDILKELKTGAVDSAKLEKFVKTDFPDFLEDLNYAVQNEFDDLERERWR